MIAISKLQDIYRTYLISITLKFFLIGIDQANNIFHHPLLLLQNRIF